MALIVCPAGHPTGQAVARALADADCTVETVPTVYDAAIRLGRDSLHYAAAIVAVDFLMGDELRFFPMAARRWPHVETAAVSRPAFAHKLEIAQLAGAGAVCAEPSRAQDLVAWFLEAMEPAAPTRVDELSAGIAPPQAAPQPAGRAPAAAPPEAPAADAPAAPPEAAAPTPARRPPSQPHPESHLHEEGARGILTEEEITALMADLDADAGDDDE
jgi:hypothetical protein